MARRLRCFFAQGTRSDLLLRLVSEGKGVEIWGLYGGIFEVSKSRTQNS